MAGPAGAGVCEKSSRCLTAPPGSSGTERRARRSTRRQMTNKRSRCNVCLTFESGVSKSSTTNHAPTKALPCSCSEEWAMFETGQYQHGSGSGSSSSIGGARTRGEVEVGSVSLLHVSR